MIVDRPKSLIAQGSSAEVIHERRIQRRCVDGPGDAAKQDHAGRPRSPRNPDIGVLRQFLLEAILLAIAGGALGLLLGFGGSELLSEWFQWPTRVSSGAVVLALAFSSAIGLFFGYYPARRAARLDPIDALRHE